MTKLKFSTHRYSRLLLNAFFAPLLILLTTGLSHAVSSSLIPAPPVLASTSYLLMDAHSGDVLVQYNAHQRLPIASLTKMMTSYVAAHEVALGKIHMDDQVLISVKAWKKGGSKMYVREGTHVKLSDLLRGIIIQSGNDASIAVAEHIAGSEDAFADLMNQHAIQLGMKDTHFVNATGWPDDYHYSTAADMALLAQALIRDYPSHYAIYSEKYFTYNDIRQPNRNRLLWRDPSVDGVKTGHTEEAGFCLVSSAERDGMRLISAVLGTKSDEARASESLKLLTYGFRFFETHNTYGPGEVLNEAEIWMGEKDTVPLGLNDALTITIPRGQKDNLKAQIRVEDQIKAPIQKGDSYGKLVLTLGDDVITEQPLIALESIEEAGLFKKIWHWIYLFILGLIG